MGSVNIWPPWCASDEGGESGGPPVRLQSMIVSVSARY